MKAPIEQHDIDSALLMQTTPAVTLFDSMDGWKRVFEDATAVAFVRSPAAGAKPAPATMRQRSTIGPAGSINEYSF